MSGSSGEKTEEPTPKKIRDARKKGQVAKSKDVASTFLIISIFAYFNANWDTMLKRASDMVHMPPAYYNVNFMVGLRDISSGVFHEAVMILLPIVGMVAIVGIFANYIQVGFLLAFEGLKPDLNKLNPINGVKKIFAMKNVVEFIKSSLKVIILGVVIFFVVKDEINPLLKIPYTGLDGVLAILSPALKHLAIMIGLAYIAIAVFDWFFQKKQYIKGLKMTKDEVKREYKEQEGDPEIKGKRKQLHQEMAMEDASQNTKKSSVLVTNPTHIAVALLYDEKRTKLPIVTAKGEGYLAQRMKKAAEEAGVPIYENVPLAHQLFGDAPLKEYIPSDLIEPVAEVLRWVQQLERQ